MQRISFAPVLSATLSRDSCWIIGFLLVVAPVLKRPGGRLSLTELSSGSGAAAPRVVLLGLLEDLDDAPALGGRQRTGLHDPDPVADAALVLLVVRLQLAGAAQDLAVQRVLDAVLDGDDHGLLHLVADHQALTHLAGRAGPGVLGRGGLVAHV